MLRNHLTFHHHIIYVDFDVFSPIATQTSLSSFSDMWIIHSSNQIALLVMVVPDRGNKSSLLLIVQDQRYLMIALKGIQETHPRMADNGIYQLVYLGHRKWILGASFI